ncbi:MAG: AAA family ATPase [Proteobacteria bacterium]|nr:AAA family ATPase [Pseudomonadota bacterium]
MSFTIGITGKGGTGKTTVAGVIVSRLIARHCSPVLAVDADPNTCLDEVLGVKVLKSVGSVREEAKQIAGKGLSAGISKQELLEIKIAQSLVETDDFDLIAMGRPEGPGCYCYANNVLKETLLKIAKNYPYIVIDNEAGLENLSRRIVQEIDLLITVADPSKRGLDTVERLHGLASEMKVKYKRLAIVVNRLPNSDLPVAAEALRDKIGADYLAFVQDDEELFKIAEQGKSVTLLPETNGMVKGIEALLDAAQVGSKDKGSF